mgnify:CR=1 FL=1
MRDPSIHITKHQFEKILSARFNKKFGVQLAEIIREINTYIYEGAA